MKPLNKITAGLIVATTLLPMSSCMDSIESLITKDLYKGSKATSSGVTVDEPSNITENSVTVTGRCNSLADIKHWGVTLFYNDTIEVDTKIVSAEETEKTIIFDDLYSGLEYQVGAFVVLNAAQETYLPSKKTKFVTKGTHTPFISLKKAYAKYIDYTNDRYNYKLTFELTISPELRLSKIARAGVRMYVGDQSTLITTSRLTSRTFELPVSYKAKEKTDPITMSVYIKMVDGVFEEGEKETYYIN